MNIADRPLVETEYLLEVAQELGYLAQEACQFLENLHCEVGVVLNAFVKDLRNRGHCS